MADIHIWDALQPGILGQEVQKLSYSDIGRLAAVAGQY
jgi:hypothetical protein